MPFACTSDLFLRSRPFSFPLTLILAAASLALSAARANAAVVFFDSFEAGTGSPAYADVPDFGGGNDLNGVNGWTIVSGVAQYGDPDDSGFFGATGNNVQGDLPHGGQILATVEGATIVNTLAATTIAGTTYTLSMRIGDSLVTDPAQTSLALLIGGSPVATVTGTSATNSSSSPGTYVFDTLTTTPYVATVSGQSIGIRIDTVGFVSETPEFTTGDMVQLDATATEANAIPEPATFVLAGIGLLGLGLIAWRRRKSS